MTKKLFVIVSFSALVFSCNSHLFLKNQTRATGYAMGEKVELKFATNLTDSPADSIETSVLEFKTGYVYNLWLKRAGCDTLCQYSSLWDGRKPDGSWPSGGRYLVFAMMNERTKLYSDTVRIGLGD